MSEPTRLSPERRAEIERRFCITEVGPVGGKHTVWAMIDGAAPVGDLLAEIDALNAEAAAAAPIIEAARRLADAEHWLAYWEGQPLSDHPAGKVIEQIEGWTDVADTARTDVVKAAAALDGATNDPGEDA